MILSVCPLIPELSLPGSFRGLGYDLVTQRLPGKHKDLGSITNATKKILKSKQLCKLGRCFFAVDVHGDNMG